MLSKKCIRVMAILSISFILVGFLRKFINFNDSINNKLKPPIGHQQELDFDSTDRTGPVPFLHGAPIGKDLVIHSAIFDSRARNGHFNATVIFISVDTSILDSNRILGCGFVGGGVALHHSTRSVAESLKMHEWLGARFFKYENVVMECYDLPTREGDKVFVSYAPSENSSLEFAVESEQPLVIPAPRVAPTSPHNFTVVTCTKVHNRRVAFFPEFIRYQRTIGVDHVHASIPDTFIMDGGLLQHLTKEPSLRQAIKDGYLTFGIFKNWYNDSLNEVFVHSESLRKLDCIYRFRGTYDYAFPLDTDDFFTPRVPGRTQLKDYIRDHCHVKPAASCMFKWYFYFPLLCGMKGEVGEDGNVTHQLRSHRPNTLFANVKSVHNTNLLVDCTFHHAECEGCLLPGYRVARVSPKEAYIAHNRLDYGDRSQEDAC